MTLRIEPYAGDGADWDAFVLAHPEARFSQLFGYGRVVEESYGFKPRYQVLRRGGRLVGVFPVFLAKGLLLGRRLISLPFCEYGGPLLGDLSEDEGEALGEELKRLVEAERAPLEIRGGLGMAESFRERHLAALSGHEYAELPLDPDPERVFRGVDRQVRKALRKAKEGGLRAIELSDEVTLRERFYPLFLQSMKRLGSPPHPWSYYGNLHRHLGAHLKVFWAEREGELISGLLGFTLGRRIHIFNIVSDERHWELRPNDLVHWEFIKWGCEQGYEVFDFSTVRYEGQRRFKEKWGCRFQDYRCYQLAANGQQARGFDSSSGLAERLAGIWRDYVPMAVARGVGPYLRKQLGK